jgi:SNF2 family DNA or RNA helicase
VQGFLRDLGHGLNLQYGGRHTIWYGLTASLELYQQFNARLRRPGQKSDRVFLHRIITRGTFDERLVEILTDKSANQDRVKSAVRMQLSQA